MTRGRKKLPAELLKLRGTDRRDRERPSSTIGDSVSPDEIAQKCQVSGLQSATKRARGIYWSLVRRVATQGMLDPSFCQQLYIYAVELDLFMKCEQSVKKDGLYLTIEGKNGPVAVPNPSFKMMQSCADKLVKIGSNFGFSPVDRQRLKIQAEAPKATGIKAIFAVMADEDGEPEEQ